MRLRWWTPHSASSGGGIAAAPLVAPVGTPETRSPEPLFRRRSDPRQISVCHVLEATSGGARRYVLDLIGHLPPERYLSTLVYSSERADAAFYDGLERLEGKVELIRIPMVASLSPAQDLRSTAELTRLFRKRHFHLIHAHSGKAGLVARVAARAAGSGAVVVYSPHGSPYRRGHAYLLAERTLGHFTDRIVAVSPSEREELLACGIGAMEMISVVTGGVDVGQYHLGTGSRDDILEKLDFAPDCLLIGTSGRLCVDKAPLSFVEMARRVAALEPRARFVWIGDGEMRPDVEEAVARYGLTDRLRITGWLPDIRDHLAALDVFCLLSASESLGFVTLEAMATGLPFVGSRVTGTRDVVEDGVTGMLVDLGDHDGVARSVVDLCGSATLRASMGHAGTERVRTSFTMQRMSVDAARAYATALQTARRHASVVGRRPRLAPAG